MRIDDPQLLTRVSEILKAMADPTRLRILQALMEAPKRVGTLVEEVGTTQANVSKHLCLLKHAGLVAARREGMGVEYRLAAPFVSEVCEVMCRGLVGQLAGGVRLHRNARRLVRRRAAARGARS